MVTFDVASYEDYEFPVWADALGWLMGLSTLIPMPIFGIYTLIKKKYVRTYISPKIIN